MKICWICNKEDKLTGEHVIKRSDIKSVFGDKRALFLHNDKRRNIKIQSIDSNKIKSPVICNECNSARTKPHDDAWKQLSETLRAKTPVIKPKDIIRANVVFPYNTHKHMLNVHLFFVKWLGCEIVKNNIPINPEVDSFSNAIMEGKPHPNIWLAFGCFSDCSVAVSNMDAASFNSGDDRFDYIARFYQVGILAVRVRFSSVKLKDDWHPKEPPRFVITDFG